MAQKYVDLAERSEHDGRNEALRLRALQAAIGQELRALYAPPEHMPHRLFTLLMQLDAEAPIAPRTLLKAALMFAESGGNIFRIHHLPA
jgi:hypothetical protein